MSPTAEGQAGTAQQQEAEGPHAVAESVDEEGEESEEEEEDDDIHWGGDVDGAGSDASSEASDMPEIIPGDPAEAAAADAEGYAFFNIAVDKVLDERSRPMIGFCRPVLAESL